MNNGRRDAKFMIHRLRISHIGEKRLKTYPLLNRNGKDIDMPEALNRMTLTSSPRFPGNKFRPPDCHHVTQRNGNSQNQVTRVRITLFAPAISFLVNLASSPSTSPTIFNFLSSLNRYGVTMAPSLQELIDFLLNEVALCGSQGVYSSNLSDPLFLSLKYMPDASSFIRQWNMHVSHVGVYSDFVLGVLYFSWFSHSVTQAVTLWQKFPPVPEMAHRCCTFI